MLEPLATFLDAAGLGEGPIDARPLGDGHSNVTYELRRARSRVVLRRPPRPPFPPSAHNMLREARLLRRLRGAGARVPEVLAVCDDEAVLGVPFYVMEHLEGHVISTSLPDVFEDPATRRRLGEELVDALIELHSIDVVAAGLSDLGPPTGYLARQLRRFSSIWEEQRTRDLPELEFVGRWLHERAPSSSDRTVVHGDYRLGNVMFDDPPGGLTAVLDWEMTTLGDPLADLGYLCATWADPSDDDDPMRSLSRVTRLPGFPRSKELLDRYEAGTGRDASNLDWYEVLALWKCAIFLESSYRRFIEGRTDDPYFATLVDGVPSLARAAHARIRALR